MPLRILSEAELARFERWPAHVPSAELVRSFTLTGPDCDLIAVRRRPANRLGIAMQLCALRYLGFVPEDLKFAPLEAIRFVADQLKVSSSALETYGGREQTQSDHFGEVREHLGYSLPRPQDYEGLLEWLVDRALEHDKAILLLRLACDRLRAQRIVRPPGDRLVRLVGTARQEAQSKTFRLLEPLLTPTRRAQLDRLLTTQHPRGRSRLAWLGEGAGGENPSAIKGELEKIEYLRQLGIHQWDLSVLNPNRRKFLAQVGRRSTNQALERMPEQRRYPILLGLLHETLIDLVDEVVDLYNRTLQKSAARSRRELDEWRAATARATNEKMSLFSQIGRLILDPAIPDEQLRQRIFEEVSSRDRFEVAVEDSQRLLRPLDDTHFDLIEHRYGHIRQFAPAVLEALEFRSLSLVAPLHEAVELLQTLNRERRRRVPDDAGLGFVPSKWRPHLVDEQGRIDRHLYELCVLFQLRDALRSGDIWLEGSRRFANPATYLISADRWPVLRGEVCRILTLTEHGPRRLATIAESIDNLVDGLENHLENSETVRLQDDRVVISPHAAEQLPEEIVSLSVQVAQRLPRIELADLLIEVDRWTGFTKHFTHAGGAKPRNPDLTRHLYATILAQACNFGLTTMAEVSDLSYRQLAWTTDWYLREETLKAAFSALVDYQHRLPLAQAWGGGALSSSDGQRFPVRGRAENATALPRYFGLGKGLTFYTWTSDQYSQYGSKVISSTVRDATYILDEILDNQTDLPILEHTTDTAGYTELVFALFDLLGLQFAPRIRDLGAQRLYRLDSQPRKDGAGTLLKGVVARQRILQRWDDLLRVAGSLKLGWVTASLLISKLQAGVRQNALTRALREYGRLVKTCFILQWIKSEDYRRRIHRQLNKGEALHALRRFLFFAHEGKVRRRQTEQQTDQILCLNLVTNAVVTWNTVYMEAALAQLRTEGVLAGDLDLSHLSPALYGHLNPYGKYRFDLDEDLHGAALRPLRTPGDDP